MPSMRRWSHASLVLSLAGMPRSSFTVSRSIGADNTTALASATGVIIAPCSDVARYLERLGHDALKHGTNVARQLAADVHLSFGRDRPARRAELQHALEDIGAQLVKLGLDGVGNQVGDLLVFL